MQANRLAASPVPDHTLLPFQSTPPYLPCLQQNPPMSRDGAITMLSHRKRHLPRAMLLCRHNGSCDAVRSRQCPVRNIGWFEGVVRPTVAGQGAKGNRNGNRRGLTRLGKGIIVRENTLKMWHTALSQSSPDSCEGEDFLALERRQKTLDGAVIKHQVRDWQLQRPQGNKKEGL